MKTENAEVILHEPGTPASLIELAIKQNLDIEKLKELFSLNERWEANQARKACFEALAGFQAECPVITKNKTADYPSKTGGRVSYKFATLDTIISQIKEPLKKYGLSYRWENQMSETNISVTCIVTHVAGHSERSTFSAVADSSGNKNDIQGRGSTLTYLRRYTLTGILGIGTAEDDVDGRQKKEPAQTLSPIIQERINKCKTLDELSAFYTNEPDLRDSKTFLSAMSKRKSELTPKTK